MSFIMELIISAWENVKKIDLCIKNDLFMSELLDKILRTIPLKIPFEMKVRPNIGSKKINAILQQQKAPHTHTHCLEQHKAAK